MTGLYLDLLVLNESFFILILTFGFEMRPQLPMIEQCLASSTGTIVKLNSFDDYQK